MTGIWGRSGYVILTAWRLWATQPAMGPGSALRSCEQGAEGGRLAGGVRHVQTATEPAFQDEFVSAMAIPHASDPFPHLDDILASRPSDEKAAPRERRRAKPVGSRGQHGGWTRPHKTGG